MERNIDQNGKSYINITKAWDNVRRGKNHSHPTLLIICDNESLIDYILCLANTYQHAKYIVEYTEKVINQISTLDINILFRSSFQMTDIEREKEWHKIDIIYTINRELGLEAQLNGVTWAQELDDLESILKRKWTDDNIYIRLDNFENAKKILTSP